MPFPGAPSFRKVHEKTLNYCFAFVKTSLPSFYSVLFETSSLRAVNELSNSDTFEGFHVLISFTEFPEKKRTSINGTLTMCHIIIFSLLPLSFSMKG